MIEAFGRVNVVCGLAVMVVPTAGPSGSAWLVKPSLFQTYCSLPNVTIRTGDVKKLKPPLTGFRLRCGDYRVFFDPKDENTIEITGVKNRREAYR